MTSEHPSPGLIYPEGSYGLILAQGSYMLIAHLCSRAIHSEDP